MRTLLLLAAALTATAADAQTNVFYAERGHWFVGSSSTVCRALNRPPADFNASPYNALQIAVRGDGSIAAEVYFWPAAITNPDRDYVLQLAFNLTETLSLKAKPVMGYMLASEPNVKLWRSFQDSTSLAVAVEGEPALVLHFGLDDMDWVLSMLTTCQRGLPKE